ALSGGTPQRAGAEVGFCRDSPTTMLPAPSTPTPLALSNAVAPAVLANVRRQFSAVRCAPLRDGGDDLDSRPVTEATHPTYHIRWGLLRGAVLFSLALITWQAVSRTNPRGARW